MLLEGLGLNLFIPRINDWIPETIFIKLATYISSQWRYA
jgi:hypothetical protein